MRRLIAAALIMGIALLGLLFYVSGDSGAFSDTIAGRYIQQGIGESEAVGAAEKQHPITLIRIAYGL